MSDIWLSSYLGLLVYLAVHALDGLFSWRRQHDTVFGIQSRLVLAIRITVLTAWMLWPVVWEIDAAAMTPILTVIAAFLVGHVLCEATARFSEAEHIAFAVLIGTIYYAALFGTLLIAVDRITPGPLLVLICAGLEVPVRLIETAYSTRDLYPLARILARHDPAMRTRVANGSSLEPYLPADDEAIRSLARIASPTLLAEFANAVHYTVGTSALDDFWSWRADIAEAHLGATPNPRDILLTADEATVAAMRLLAR
jgi:hypothetical protein